MGGVYLPSFIERGIVTIILHKGVPSLVVSEYITITIMYSLCSSLRVSSLKHLVL